MKHRLQALIALLLICTTLLLVACGSHPQVPGEEPSAASDASPMPAPAGGDALAYLYERGDLLMQPELTIFQLYAETNSDVFLSFAAAEDIIARGRPETPLYGLYAFAHEYSENQDTVSRVGFTNIRLTKETILKNGHLYAGMTDEFMHSVCESGISVMWTAGISACNGSTPIRSFFFPESLGAGRHNDALTDTSFEYYNLTGWLYENVNMVLDLLANYGPSGSYFERYPTANYNPIRYIELFNEPNYHYNIPAKTADGYDDAYAAIKYEAYAMLQVVVSRAVREKYRDEVKIVGFGAGGGLDYSGVAFVRDTLALSGNDRLESILNSALDPDALVRFDRDCVDTRNNNTVRRLTETERRFETRKQYAAELRTLLGMEDEETLVLDLVGSMDILSIHPYADDTSPFAAFRFNGLSQASCVAEMRTALQANVLDKSDPSAVADAKSMPIWFTECGWELKGPQAYALTYPEDIEAGIEGGKGAEYSSKQRGTSQILQAAMEVQGYLFGIRNGIDRITYMHIYDTDGCNYGLVNYGYQLGGDKSWRLTLHAIHTMIQILPNPALVGVVAENTGSERNDPYYCIYEIESDIGGEIVTTVFAPVAITEVSVPWEEDYALVTDMFGRSKILPARGGAITLTAGPYMQYIRHIDDEMLRQHYLAPELPPAGEDALAHAWRQEESVV